MLTHDDFRKVEVFADLDEAALDSAALARGAPRVALAAYGDADKALFRTT